MSESGKRKYPGLWVDPEDDPREGDVVLRGERDVLLDYLKNYRTTLAMKCDGLDAEQMARRSVPPSTMSLLGLIRHMAAVEHHWFQRVMGRRSDLGWLYPEKSDRDVDFDDAIGDDHVVAQAWADWRREVAAAEAFVDEADPSLDTLGSIRGDEIELREVLVHMIEEYARHCGHADLLRECIDGRTGQ